MVLPQATYVPWSMASMEIWSMVIPPPKLPGLVNIQKAMENGPFIDGLPIKNSDFL